MKKSLTIFFVLISILIIIIGLWIGNSLFGNPISKKIAQNSVENYISDHYNDRDFVISDIFYNFKSGYYEAEVKSQSSIDTYFTVSVYLNKIAYDSYEDDVLSGWNTYERIEREYNEIVEAVFSAPDFPLISDIAFGTIELYEERDEIGYDEADYGVKLADLELDQQYDVKKIAKTAGHIVYYAQDEDVSFERASKLLLLLKRELDSADIPFYAIDFVLEKPRNDDGRPNEDDENIYTAHFLYRDIYEEKLAERLERAHRELMDYYEEQDQKHKAS